MEQSRLINLVSITVFYVSRSFGDRLASLKIILKAKIRLKIDVQYLFTVIGINKMKV